MAERGTNRLSQAQLAEGARLLAEANAEFLRTNGAGDAFWSWTRWKCENADDLLAAARRVAEVEGCVRELKAKFYSNQLDWEALSENTPDAVVQEARRARASEWKDAVAELSEAAARHNIDLSEPTPAGEAKGTP